MTSNKTTITAFASIIALVAVGVSTTPAFALDQATADLARDTSKLLDRIESIENRLADESISDAKKVKLEAKKANLQDKVDANIPILNAGELYTSEQFEKVEQQLKFGDVPDTVEMACSQCDPVVFVKAGYDYEIGWFSGTALADNWSVTQTATVSSVDPVPWWGVPDHYDPFTLAFKDHATYADINVEMKIVNDQGLPVKTYADHDELVSGNIIINPDEYPETRYSQTAEGDVISSTVNVFLLY